MDTCYYRNNSGRMVILRCIGADCFFQEKVIFPFEDWIFCAPLQSRIEIWSHGPSGAELLDALSAAELVLSIDGLQGFMPATRSTANESAPVVEAMAVL